MTTSRLNALGGVALVGAVLLLGPRVLPALAQPDHQHPGAGTSGAAKPADSRKGGVRIGMDELHRAGGVPPGWRLRGPRTPSRSTRRAPTRTTRSSPRC